MNTTDTLVDLPAVRPSKPRERSTDAIPVVAFSGYLPVDVVPTTMLSDRCNILPPLQKAQAAIHQQMIMGTFPVHPAPAPTAAPLPPPPAWHFRARTRLGAKWQRALLWFRRGWKSAKRAYQWRPEAEIRAEKLAVLHERAERERREEEGGSSSYVHVAVLAPPPAQAPVLSNRPDYQAGRYSVAVSHVLRAQKEDQYNQQMGARYRRYLADLQKSGVNVDAPASQPLKTARVEAADLFTLGTGHDEEQRDARSLFPAS